MIPPPDTVDVLILLALLCAIGSYPWVAFLWWVVQWARDEPVEEPRP